MSCPPEVTCGCGEPSTLDALKPFEGAAGSSNRRPAAAAFARRVQDPCAVASEVEGVVVDSGPYTRLEDFHTVLEESGWVAIATSEDPLTLAEQLGRPVPSRHRGPTREEVRPRRRDEALPRSLSAIHGLAAFPLHTDGAHWAVPPRFVILRAALSSRCATTVLDSRRMQWSSHDRALLQRGVIFVRDGRGGFPTTIISRRTDWIRFDRGCMAPGNDSGRRALTIAEATLSRPCARIPWHSGVTLVIDNWRCLHGREAATGDEDRVLTRVLVS